MAKPHIHAISSAKKFGGVPEDYIDIHSFMDSSKSAIADNRHRALTHNSWFIGPGGPLERAFGVTFLNSDGRQVAVRDVGEQHILEDYQGKFIPTPQDFLAAVPFAEWMNNGNRGKPPSYEGISKSRKTMTFDLD